MRPQRIGQKRCQRSAESVAIALLWVDRNLRRSLRTLVGTSDAVTRMCVLAKVLRVLYRKRTGNVNDKCAVCIVRRFEREVTAELGAWREQVSAASPLRRAACDIVGRLLRHVSAMNCAVATFSVTMKAGWPPMAWSAVPCFCERPRNCRWPWLAVTKRLHMC
jgi:hypothetical protein